MLITFQVILLIIILSSFHEVVYSFGPMGSGKSMTFICVISILSFLVTVILL